jgi:hypothetical protein
MGQPERIDLQRLQRLAQAAASGEWRSIEYVLTISAVMPTTGGSMPYTLVGTDEMPIGQYLLAMHPQTTLSLIAALQATLAFLSTVSPHSPCGALVEGDASTLLSLFDILERVGISVPGGARLRRELES